MRYANDIRSVTDSIPVKLALREYVVAIRDATTTRTGQDERRMQDCERRLRDEVFSYALAVQLEVRCTHPNAYATGGRAMMYCPTCGPFNAMEE